MTPITDAEVTYLDTINKYYDYLLIKSQDLVLTLERYKIYPITKKLVSTVPPLELKKDFFKEEELFLNKAMLHPITGEAFLTPREQECIRKLIEGKTAKSIARSLKISHRTVEQHITNVKLKMGVLTKSELIGNLLKVEFNRRILME